MGFRDIAFSGIMPLIFISPRKKGSSLPTRSVSIFIIIFLEVVVFKFIT